MSRRGQRRTLEGVVVSDKMDKTVVVSVERLVKDPTYHKYVRRHARFLAHDEANDCAVGKRRSVAPAHDFSGKPDVAQRVCGIEAKPPRLTLPQQ